MILNSQSFFMKRDDNSMDISTKKPERVDLVFFNYIMLS